MFYFTESEADSFNPYSPNDKLTVGFYNIINSALYNIYTTSFEREPIIYIDKSGDLFCYFIVW